MLHSLIAEFLGTALMILFGVGVHCDEVLTKTKYHGSGHIFAITTWALVFLLPCLSLVVSALTLPWHYARQFLA